MWQQFFIAMNYYAVIKCMILNSTGRSRSIPYGCLKWFSTVMLIMADQVEPQTIINIISLKSQPTKNKPQPTVQLPLVMLGKLCFQWKIQRNVVYIFTLQDLHLTANRFIFYQLTSTAISLRKSSFLWLLCDTKLI